MVSCSSPPPLEAAVRFPEPALAGHMKKANQTRPRCKSRQEFPDPRTGKKDFLRLQLFRTEGSESGRKAAAFSLPAPSPDELRPPPLARQRPRAMAAVCSETELNRWTKALRKQQKRLVRTANNTKQVARPTPEPKMRKGKNFAVRTLLVLAITGSVLWAAIFMILQPPYRERPDLFPWATLVDDLLLPWIMDATLLRKVLAAAADWENNDRMMVEQFIMESLVVQKVGEQNRKGLVVPSGTVLMYYLKYWEAREGGVKARSHYARLEAGCGNIRKNWMRAFRDRWKVAHGSLLAPETHDEGEAVRVKVSETQSSSLVRLEWADAQGAPRHPRKELDPERHQNQGGANNEGGPPRQSRWACTTAGFCGSRKSCWPAGTS